MVKRRSLIVSLVYVCGSPGLSGRRCLYIIPVAYTWNPTVRRGSTEGGAVSYAPPPTPKPNIISRTGRAGQTFKHQDAGKATKGSTSSAGSQSEGCRLDMGGRRMTTGAAGGGRRTKQQTDGDEAIGGERVCAGKVPWWVKNPGESRRGERVIRAII